jgi:TetR/AcrR family transcriptional regulator, mexJK operon transcriptional repressor
MVKKQPGEQRSSRPDLRQEAPRARGRPRDASRLARVVEAAAKCFCEDGYEATSIDRIAELSGVSKVTIYSYFPSKRSLLKTAISDRIEREFAAVRWAQADPLAPQQTLTAIGAAFLRLVRSPDVIGLQRSLYGCMDLDRDVAEGLVEIGPERLLQSVAAFLELAVRHGSLSVPDPIRAADQFLSQFMGIAFIRSLLGLAAPTAAEDALILEDGVRMFMSTFQRSLPAMKM